MLDGAGPGFIARGYRINIDSHAHCSDGGMITHSNSRADAKGNALARLRVTSVCCRCELVSRSVSSLSELFVGPQGSWHWSDCAVHGNGSEPEVMFFSLPHFAKTMSCV